MPFLALLADPSPSPDAHRFRLHADVQPLSVRLRNEYGARSSDADLGLPGSAASLGFGFAPHPMVLVGLRVRGSLRTFHEEVEAWGDFERRGTYGSVGLLPYVEVRPLPRFRVQPFVLVEGGASYEGWRNTMTGTGRVTSQAVTPSVGGRVGLHAFVLPRLSIDADVGTGREWSRWVGRRASSDWSKAWVVTGTIGVSGWF